MNSLRFKHFMPERVEYSVDGEETLLSVSEYYGVKPRAEAHADDAGEGRASSLVGYRRVHRGDLVMNYMLAWKGAYGVSNYDGIVSPAYAVFYVDERAIDRRFIHHRLRSQDMRDQFASRSKGIIASRLRLYPDTFLSMRLDLPDLATQKTIADFLDRETAHIDQLIEKKQRFISLTSRRIDALVDEAISNPTVPRIRFKNVVRRMERPVVLSEHDELVRLGLFNRGRGMFKKPAADEEGMGASNFYFVRDGDLILSGQFAWEGAVALATDDEEGCVVSHRYPVFRGKEWINTAYLLGLLRSGFGDFILNESSRGSAGRNRPLNTKRLGKEKIPIPSRELQEAVDRALSFERQLKKKTEQSITLLTEVRAALITAAVTGQIDVTTWDKKGSTDRRLDQIEEEMSA